MSKTIETTKNVAADAIELALGIEELFSRGRKPNMLKRMLAGAKAIDIGYDIVEAFPQVIEEIRDLDKEEFKELVDFIKSRFKSEAKEHEVKQAISMALEKLWEFYKAVQAVRTLLRSKDIDTTEETEK